MLFSMLGKKLEAFQVERNGEFVGEFQGERRTEKNRRYIEFFEKKDIAQNDTIIDVKTQTRYSVVEIVFNAPQIIGFGGGLNDIEFKVYYTPEIQKATSPTYYINNPQNSIIGSQGHATINIGSITSIEKEIEKCAAEDKALLYEMLQLLKDYESEKKKPKKSGLKKFESVILKYVPLGLSIGEFLMNFFIH